MNRQTSNIALPNFLFLIVSFWIAGCRPANNSENTWSDYKADANGSSYSSLDQINVSNVSELENAWTFQMSDLAQGAEPVSSQSNPIIIDGVMYCQLW